MKRYAAFALSMVLSPLFWAPTDDDLTGLFFLFGHNPLQFDMEQTILELGGFDLDMFGKLELALECAAGDALMQVGRIAGLGLPFAGDGQDAIADLNAKILFSEAGHCKSDAIMIFGRCSSML